MKVALFHRKRQLLGLIGMTFVFALIILSQNTVIARADKDSDGDGVPDTVELANVRDIAVRIGKDDLGNQAFFVTSTAKAGTNRTQITFGFVFWSDSVKITTSFKEDADDPTPLYESTLALLSIVEYRDLGDIGLYDNPAAEWVQAGNFSDLNFLDFDDDSDGFDTRKIAFESADHNFTLDFYFSQQFAKVGETVISPYQIVLS